MDFYYAPSQRGRQPDEDATDPGNRYVTPRAIVAALRDTERLAGNEDRPAS